MNDEELKDLFSAFDDVSAPDALKSSTLESIMSAAAASEAAGAEAEAAPAQAPSVAATRGGKGIRTKWRAMRMAAVAACLALALTGGVAYAYPASTVLVTQGETTVELHVNVFGQVLSASANDDAMQDLIDQMGLVHTSYEDSVTRVSDSLKESNPKVPVEVTLNGVTQAVENDDGDDAPSAKPQAPEAAPSPLSTGESAVLKVDLPAVAERELAVREAAPSAETLVFLPEPSAVTDDEDQDDNPGDGNRSAGRDERSVPYPDDDPAPSGGDDDPVIEPAQPVVAIEEPAMPQDPEPADAGGDEAPADVQPAQPAEEPVYDNTRPSQYYLDEEE